MIVSKTMAQIASRFIYHIIIAVFTVALLLFAASFVFD